MQSIFRIAGNFKIAHEKELSVALYVLNVMIMVLLVWFLITILYLAGIFSSNESFDFLNKGVGLGVFFFIIANVVAWNGIKAARSERPSKFHLRMYGCGSFIIGCLFVGFGREMH